MVSAFERTPSRSAPTIHWLVRSVMWLLVALCAALPCCVLLAPFFPPAHVPVTAWTALESAGVIGGCCIFGAGFLGTLAWRGHSEIRGVVWLGNHPVAPRLPWYTRAWAGIVCTGMLLLLAAQLHRTVAGDASWLSTFTMLVTVVITFWYLTAPLLAGRWGEATLRSVPCFTMTLREMQAAVKAEHGHRRGI